VGIPVPEIVITYLIASIPFALLIGKIFGRVDVRQHGSGNVGTTNVLRTVGIGPAILVALCDVGKGFVPVYLTIHKFNNPLWTVLVGMAAIAGHNWPVFLRFRGGKGVATTYGVICGISFSAVLLVVSIWVLMMVLTKYVSLSSMIAVSTAPIILGLLKFPPEYLGLGIMAAVIVVYRHRPNIARLRAGTEPRIGQKKKKN